MISVIQVNSGMRISNMPGARILMIVTTKLKAAASEAIPRIWRLSIQKSIPAPGLKALLVKGAYPNQPALGAPPRTQLRLSISAPAKKVQ